MNGHTAYHQTEDRLRIKGHGVHGEYTTQYPAKATGEREFTMSTARDSVCFKCKFDVPEDTYDDVPCADCHEGSEHTPTLTPEPVKHYSCVGCCRGLIANNFPAHCDSCFPYDATSRAWRRNWSDTPQPPKGEDAPASKTYGYCTECDKVWQECLRLKLKIKTNGIEVTADDIIEGIRDLHRRAGENHVSAPLPDCQMCGKHQTENGSILISPPLSSGLYIKTHICVECFDKLAVTNRRGTK